MWFLSPSGWPTFADSPEEQADLTAAGYVPIDESQVQAAIDAYHAGSPPPPLPDFVDTTELDADVAGLVQDTTSGLRMLLDSLYGGGGATAVNWATVDLYGYGHSYVSGTGASDSAQYFLTVLDGLLGTNNLSNRGVAGNSMIQTTHAIATGVGGVTAWGPGARGLVVLDSVLNDVLHTSVANQDQDGIGFANSLRTGLRVLRAGGLFGANDPSVTYTGVPEQFGDPIVPGGTAYILTTTSGVAEIANYEDTEITLLLLDWSGIGTGKTCTVSVNGTTYGGSYDSGDKGALTASITGTSDGTFAWQLGSFRVAGLPAGPKTVTVTGTAGNTYFCGYLTPPVAPPSILVVQDAHLLTYPGSPYDTATGDALLDTRNATVASVCGEAEFGGTNETQPADASVGYDPNTMLYTDGIHRNDAGYQALAEALQTDANTFTARTGLN